MERPAAACPEFIVNTLEVSGPLEALHDFMAAAAGPGFIDCRPNWYAIYENARDVLIANGAPGRDAAEFVAKRHRDALWRRYEAERTAAERNPTRAPLDLNVLIPIPVRVLRAGWDAAMTWMWTHWGTPAPLRRVRCTMELRPSDRGGVRHVAVYRFLAQDWSPWLALIKLRKRWPTLRFALASAYLDNVVLLDRKEPQDQLTGTGKRAGTGARGERASRLSRRLCLSA